MALENHKAQQEYRIEVGLAHSVEDYTLLPVVQRLNAILMGERTLCWLISF